MNDRPAEEIEKDYNEAVSTVSSNYVGEIDYEKATQAAVQGMLTTLDPHSTYFPFNEFKKLKEDQDSRFYRHWCDDRTAPRRCLYSVGGGEHSSSSPGAAVWRSDFGSRWQRRARLVERTSFQECARRAGQARDYQSGSRRFRGAA